MAHKVVLSRAVVDRQMLLERLRGKDVEQATGLAHASVWGLLRDIRQGRPIGLPLATTLAFALGLPLGQLLSVDLAALREPPPGQPRQAAFWNAVRRCQSRAKPSS